MIDVLMIAEELAFCVCMMSIVGENEKIGNISFLIMCVVGLLLIIGEKG